jgi:sugar/nucleoside kinase (ribokinase family)
MERKGICVAGNMIVDILYPVSGLPGPGELTSIKEGISRSMGGTVCNVIADIAALDGGVPLTALGRIGDDGDGDMVLDMLGRFKNVDLSLIKREGRTSFTAVMADEITKQRTFYHYRGSNALFCEDDIEWDKIKAEILHAGYILLLDALDAPDEECGTKMARLLRGARERGMKTSVDVVSESGDRFAALVPPALKYADYCVINEYEASRSVGVPLRSDDGKLLTENLRPALTRLMECGVREWAVIHSPEGGYGADSGGKFESVDSLALPDGYIKGAVGAGDAFCAGVLYAAYKKMSLRDAIETGIGAAACSLSHADATEGMREYGQVMEFYRDMR